MFTTFDEVSRDAGCENVGKINFQFPSSREIANHIFFCSSSFSSFLLPTVIDALRDVQVTVPQAVRRGDNAMLYCHYDMDGENLYSVKWYKGRREFYRYTPKENPAMKVFPVAGVIVKVSVLKI